MASRAAGEPPLAKRCKCGANIAGLSDYHLNKHYEGRKHQSALNVSQLQPISSFFAPCRATASSIAAAPAALAIHDVSGSSVCLEAVLENDFCSDDDCVREPGDTIYDNSLAIDSPAGTWSPTTTTHEVKDY